MADSEENYQWDLGSERVINCSKTKFKLTTSEIKWQEKITRKDHKETKIKSSRPTKYTRFSNKRGKKCAIDLVLFYFTLCLVKKSCNLKRYLLLQTNAKLTPIANWLLALHRAMGRLQIFFLSSYGILVKLLHLLRLAVLIILSWFSGPSIWKRLSTIYKLWLTKLR